MGWKTCYDNTATISLFMPWTLDHAYSIQNKPKFCVKKLYSCLNLRRLVKHESFTMGVVSLSDMYSIFAQHLIRFGPSGAIWFKNPKT